MDLAQLIYRYSHFVNLDNVKAESLKGEILDIVKKDSMGCLYKSTCNKFNWEFDESLYETMNTKLTEELKKVEEKKAEALENAGDTEVLDAMFEKANLLCVDGDWVAATEAYDEILTTDKKLTSSKKIDAMCDKTRISLFLLDSEKTASLIEETKKLNDTGGDWDRRNRLKIYEALYLISKREIKKAAPLLLECIETFTCVELCSYSTFMFYAVICNIMTLPRTELYKKVIKNPQVIAMIDDIPHLRCLLHSIYDCEYANFFREMVHIQPYLAQDRYCGSQVQFFMREYKLLAFNQYLEPYKSVLLTTMAESFGITVDMLDVEISKAIASSRIAAKIDKVGGVIQNSVKHDKKNIQYNDVISKGDTVLNQIQKLARTLDM